MESETQTVEGCRSCRDAPMVVNLGTDRAEVIDQASISTNLDAAHLTTIVSWPCCCCCELVAWGRNHRTQIPSMWSLHQDETLGTAKSGIPVLRNVSSSFGPLVGVCASRSGFTWPRKSNFSHRLSKRHPNATSNISQRPCFLSAFCVVEDHLRTCLLQDCPDCTLDRSR